MKTTNRIPFRTPDEAILQGRIEIAELQDAVHLINRSREWLMTLCASGDMVDVFSILARIEAASRRMDLRISKLREAFGITGPLICFLDDGALALAMFSMTYKVEDRFEIAVDSNQAARFRTCSDGGWSSWRFYL